MIGTITAVVVDSLGGALLSGVSSSGTVLPLDLTVDFDEDGGSCRINDVDYEWVAVDDGTVTLASGLTGAADEADPVIVLDAEGNPAVEWTVWVALEDDEGDPVPVTIPTALIGDFPEGDEAAGQLVEVVADREGGLTAVGRVDQARNIDGSVVRNPHVQREMSAVTFSNDVWTVITGYTDVEVEGITVSGGDHTVVEEGFYVFSGQVAFASNTTGRRKVRVMINGGQGAFISVTPEDAGSTYAAASSAKRLYPGDVVTVEARQTSGAGLALVVGSGVSQFTMYRSSV